MVYNIEKRTSVREKSQWGYIPECLDGLIGTQKMGILEKENYEEERYE